ncbi:hypothetical protein [Streptomyces yanii]|uniref:Uncharacterized protein n=1 Tax=Streptomyces yanii TaxID=78510 RepID=A0ABV5RBP9_9ACTN
MGGVAGKIGQTNKPLAVFFLASAAVGIYGWYFESDDNGDKRPALTILGEIAAVVGTALVVIELIR